MGDNGRESNFLTVGKLDVDVSEALVGLKAVTREAKEATRALWEMERTYERATGVIKSLQHFTTKELHEELAKRTGATEFVADPHRYFDICVNGTVYSMSGPARILVNRD